MPAPQSAIPENFKGQSASSLAVLCSPLDAESPTSPPLTPLPTAPHLPAEIKQSREETIRQSWIGVMEARLVREELAKCWRTEGASLHLSPSLTHCDACTGTDWGWG